jgi:hypothetical protein
MIYPSGNKAKEDAVRNSQGKKEGTQQLLTLPGHLLIEQEWYSQTKCWNLTRNDEYVLIWTEIFENSLKVMHYILKVIDIALIEYQEYHLSVDHH